MTEIHEEQVNGKSMGGPPIQSFFSNPGAHKLQTKRIRHECQGDSAQCETAEKLGANRATIKNWEAGLHQPAEKSLDLIEGVPQSR